MFVNDKNIIMCGPRYRIIITRLGYLRCKGRRARYMYMNEALSRDALRDGVAMSQVFLRSLLLATAIALLIVGGKADRYISSGSGSGDQGFQFPSTSHE